MFTSLRGRFGLLGLTLLAIPVLTLQADDPPKPRPDRPKSVIELPTKNLVARGTASPKVDGDNPHVEPGKVKWHATIADACAASAKSKKPVLLFQMLGKLDDQFC
jgi:hypothetical protein